MTSVLTNCVKRTTDVVADFRMSLGFHLEGQLHERSFESELILVHPFQNV